MTMDLATLIARLRVEPTGNDGFRGLTMDVGSPNVYGGQLLGQSVMAAGATVSDVQGERPVHALHAVFLRLGDKHRPVDYVVHRQHDGASFSRRRVVASQQGRAFFEAQLSFQRPESSAPREASSLAEPVGSTGLPVAITHQIAMPDVPPASALADECELQMNMDPHLRRRLRLPPEGDGWMPAIWPLEWRPVRPVHPLEPAAGPPQAAWWLRASGRLPDEPLLHAAMLAYASDYSLLQSALLPHRLNFLQPGLRIASLDHALWLLRPARVDDWLLFDTCSPSLGDGRALVRGNVFASDGRLVASVAQEGFVGSRRPAAQEHGQ